MRSFVALSVAILATFVSASPVTIPLKKLQRSGSYLKGSPDADRARVAFLRSRAASGPTTIHATNLAYVQYTAEVGIGNPPTYYNLIVDTGSSNTFCGTGKKPYIRTNTSIFTGEHVNVTYGEGSFSGLEYLDQVTLAPNLVITNQSVGDALSWADFPGVDGIVGVGPVNLTLGMLSPDVNATIPTVMNNLVSQGLLEHEVLGVYFAPSTKYCDTNGALTYGGVDPKLYNGELTFTPVTKTLPAGHYWGINVTLATYGNHTVIPTSHAGIVDTGTTQILLKDEFFEVYRKAIPGAIMNESVGLLEIPRTSVPHMYPLDFTIGGRVFSMDVASQLIPEYQNEAWGGEPGKLYGVVGNFENANRFGLDFNIGQKFMERYYTVFDTENQRVGFAETNNTFSEVEE